MTVDHLGAIAVFIRVVEAKSFTGAAKRLGLTPSAVSKQVAKLEDRLGVQLLNRTTRSLGLTEAGSGFYRRCSRILGDIDEAEREAVESQATPRGTLRVTAPNVLAELQLAGMLPRFLKPYPDLKVEAIVSDRLLDLVDDNIDVAIRVGDLPDSSMISRRLGPNRRMIVGAPGYLDEFGRPASPRELDRHNCIVFSANGEPRDTWHFDTPTGPTGIRVRGNMVTDNIVMALNATMAGGGLALMSAFGAGPYVRDGSLETVLDDYLSEHSTIQAVYPAARHASTKVRAFVDFLVSEYGRMSGHDN